MPSYKPKRLQLVVVHWFDIEQGAGWGDISDEFPVVIQAGFIHARPSKRQKIPMWKIKGSQSEDEPGTMCNIPACNVLKMEVIGWQDVPWRAQG